MKNISDQNPQINISSWPRPEYLKQLHAVYLTAGAESRSVCFSLIRGYLSRGHPQEALLVYAQYYNGGRSFTFFPLLIKACASLMFLRLGSSLHAESLKIGVVDNVIVGTSFVSLYSKCRNIVNARHMFDEMPERNVVTWNAMIGGYSRVSDMQSALELFEKMSERTQVTWTEMIDGFARSGATATARRFFDGAPFEWKNVVMWTVMVDGYARNGEMEAACEVFEAMPERNFYAWSCLVDGYCKKGDLREARKVFDRIPVRNLVNWNALIAGYAQNGFCKEALGAFREMQAQGFKPDEVTVASVLSACGQLGCLDDGKEVHRLICRDNIRLNQFVLNGLVDMYCKCGDLETAKAIFQGMGYRNEVCWNAMISGLAYHGQSKDALGLFGRMEESSQKPNETTFLAALWACAHGGYVEEGLKLFSKMKEKYSLTAGIEHYGCLIDLLSRAGRLSEAIDLIKRMPLEPNDVIWGTLLGACRLHMNTNMADCILKEVGGKPADSSDCHDDAHYVLVSNIFAASARWEEAERVRLLMLKNKVQKTAGCSSIMLGSCENKFHGSAQTRPQSQWLYNVA